MIVLCGRVWCWFVGNVFLVCVGEFGVGLWEVSVCCVWENLVWVCGKSVCDVCGSVWCGYVGSVCVLFVAVFGVGL